MHICESIAPRSTEQSCHLRSGHPCSERTGTLQTTGNMGTPAPIRTEDPQIRSLGAVAEYCSNPATLPCSVWGRDAYLLTKRCAPCGLTKPIGAFNRSKAARDGLQSRCRECSKASGRDHYRRNRRQVIAKASRRKRDPIKRRAHKAVARALHCGKLRRSPCEQCGAGKADAHHDDYSRPLDVRWLCRTHHRLHHERHGE